MSGIIKQDTFTDKINELNLISENYNAELKDRKQILNERDKLIKQVETLDNQLKKNIEGDEKRIVVNIEQDYYTKIIVLIIFILLLCILLYLINLASLEIDAEFLPRQNISNR